MARKKKHEEHENLERWLISYADFITLLFATFVVLYALSQVDIKDFKSLEDSIRQAFSAPSITQGSAGLMNEQSDTIFDKQQADSLISPLMMEYLSQKYENQSIDQIEQQITEMQKSGDLEGVDAVKTDRGLVIRFSSDYLFKSGSATITPGAKLKLDIVGMIIAKKFILHQIRVEGHTDNQAINSPYFPSNWELSSARSSAVIRYYISRFGFMPSLFTAIGYAETRPISENKTESGRTKNRRVDVVILKNKFKSQENPQNDITKMSKDDQEKMMNTRMVTINKIESMTDAARKLADTDKRAQENAAILNQVYQKELHRISKETKALDPETQTKITGKGEWLKPPANPTNIQLKDKKDNINLKNEVYKQFSSIDKQGK